MSGRRSGRTRRAGDRPGPPDAAPTTPPADAAARERIVHAEDRTLFVEAGAGTGKTRTLVDRVVHLVSQGVPLDRIAAITFTEKAATELRERIRSRLLHLVAPETEHPGTDTVAGSAARVSDEQRVLLADALDAVDRAAVGTLHAFAQRILLAFPIEAGLPPRVEVLDEIASEVAFDERWRSFLLRLLDDEAFGRSVLLLLAVDIQPVHLRLLARRFEENWDLVAERIADHAGPPPSPIDVRPVRAAVADLVARAARCVDDSDRLLDRIGEIARWDARLDLVGEDDDLLRVLQAAPSCRVGNVGRKGSWVEPIGDVRDAVIALGELVDALRTAAVTAALWHLAGAIGRFTLEAADDRRRRGELAFHDLLVLARDLVRRAPAGGAVRTRLHQSYQRLLLDEFQDTDPIQLELATWIAAPPDQAASRWEELEPVPGRLFFVGDPKQSIYRFRRADIQLYLDTAARYTAGGERLRVNFRTVAPVLDWINHVFGRLLVAVPGSQPAYAPLTAHVADGRSHRVLVLGIEAHTDASLDAAELRRREAREVASTIRDLLQERVPVRDRVTGRWRDPRCSDVAVLLPARTSLDALESALAEHALPSRAESSSLVYGTREVRDLMSALRAVADRSDEHALVTALRTTMFGCSDVDLLRYRQAGGRWDHQSGPPNELAADDPVAEGLALLGRLHRAMPWSTPAELLDDLVEARRVMEAGALDGRPRDVWRRIRFVVDQARAWHEVTGGTVRGYLAWVAGQSAEGVRVIESVLPETDDDAVRIMTIHAAKGLEFPIVVVSGMTTQSQHRHAKVEVLWPPDRIAIKVGAQVTTPEFDEYQPIDEQMASDERVRLLYVACTRARDHLVVSLHRATRRREPERGLAAYSNAELLEYGAQGAPAQTVPGLTTPALPLEPATRPIMPVLAESFAEWEARTTEALTSAGRPRTVGASALAHVREEHADPLDDALDAAGATESAAVGELGSDSINQPVEHGLNQLVDGESLEPGAEDVTDPGLAKGARDLELSPWQRGRYGTAIGRAVHGVLQTIDLRTGAGLAAAAAAQAAAEGVLGREDLVAALAAAALAAPPVRAAAAGEHWRELYVAAPVGDLLVEGYVDLLHRTTDGLVVVDYKTDHVPSPAQRAERSAAYAVQLAAYALALEATTATPVVRCELVYLSPGGATVDTVAGERLTEARATALERATALGQVTTR